MLMVACRAMISGERGFKELRSILEGSGCSGRLGFTGAGATGALFLREDFGAGASGASSDSESSCGSRPGEPGGDSWSDILPLVAILGGNSLYHFWKSWWWGREGQVLVCGALLVEWAGEERAASDGSSRLSTISSKRDLGRRLNGISSSKHFLTTSMRNSELCQRVQSCQDFEMGHSSRLQKTASYRCTLCIILF